MITLSGVELSKHMLWTDRNSHSPVAQASARTLGGVYRSWAAPLYGGRPITLEASESGWLTYAQVKAVAAMADVAGATYSLSYHGEVFAVAFRHEDPPAIEFNPLMYRAVPLDTDYYVGVIRLITL